MTFHPQMELDEFQGSLDAVEGRFGNHDQMQEHYHLVESHFGEHVRSRVYLRKRSVFPLEVVDCGEPFVDLDLHSS